MQYLDTLIKGSAEGHVHLCPGQVIEVRLAMRGCRLKKYLILRGL